MYEIGYRDPKKYRTVMLFYKVKEPIVKYGYNEMDMIENFVMLPWAASRQRKLITKDSELYFFHDCF